MTASELLRLVQGIAQDQPDATIVFRTDAESGRGTEVEVISGLCAYYSERFLTCEEVATLMAKHNQQGSPRDHGWYPAVLIRVVD